MQQARRWVHVLGVLRLLLAGASFRFGSGLAISFLSIEIEFMDGMPTPNTCLDAQRPATSLFHGFVKYETAVRFFSSNKR